MKFSKQKADKFERRTGKGIQLPIHWSGRVVGRDAGGRAPRKKTQQLKLSEFLYKHLPTF